MSDLFSIWCGMEPLGKAKNPANGGGAQKMVGRVGGIISTEARDQQGEIIVQEGVDWSYLLEKGWLNWEHKAGPENVLGHVDRVFRTTHRGAPATGMEGVLYLHKAKARETYETAEAMQKAGTSRRIGFSVEGGVVLRSSQDRRRIEKSKVLNVAVTAHPVMADARLQVLAKSLSAAGVGYQTPALPYGNGLSVLTPQSIAARPSSATFGDITKRITKSELVSRIRVRFPHLTASEAGRLAGEWISALG
jgi:hypothetical protein